MLKALHTHDCDVCALVGHLPQKDVYYCSAEGSVVVRKSDEEADYVSFPMSVARLVAEKSPDWALPVALCDAFLAGRMSS